MPTENEKPHENSKIGLSLLVKVQKYFPQTTEKTLALEPVCCSSLLCLVSHHMSSTELVITK
jgi:hypothetical protein